MATQTIAITRTAKAKAEAANLTPEKILEVLGLPDDHKIGAGDVDSALQALEGDTEAAAKAQSQIRHHARWEELEFPVSLHNLFYKEGDVAEDPEDRDAMYEVENRRALVRDDSGIVLNVVSDRYKLVQHADVFAPVDEAIADMGLGVDDLKVSVGMFGGYAQVMWVFNNPLEVARGDVVKMAIIARNSYNYESGMTMEFGGFRLICENGLISPVSSAKVGGRHMKNLSVEKAISAVQGFLDNSEDTLKFWQGLTEKKLDRERFAALLAGQQHISKKGQEEVLAYLDSEREAAGGNVWGAYNAVTWYGTHQVEGGRGDRAALTRDAILRFANTAAQELVRA